MNFKRIVIFIKRKFYTRVKKLFRIKYTQILITNNCYKFLVPDDLIWAFPAGDYYEQNVIYFLDRIVKSYHLPVMIDVGASCGYYSIRYSSHCKQIFSFEPVTETYKFLEKNIKKNAIKNLISLKSGLSDKNEEKIINLYNTSANNSVFERIVPKGHSLQKIGVETIVLNSLDDLIENKKIAIPNIIKIDVEGAELQVLKGAKRTISKYRPSILLEYSENTSKDAGYSKDLLLNILELDNYNIYGIPEYELDFKLIKREDFEKHSIANLIFLPAELDSYL
jgi:FkbM family methyltransferase